VESTRTSVTSTKEANRGGNRRYLKGKGKNLACEKVDGEAAGLREKDVDANKVYLTYLGSKTAAFEQ
jgi:hypothetical protein